MGWKIVFCAEFVPEFAAMSEVVQDELLAQLIVLKQFGPALGRPHVDTLKGSRYANMKELRFKTADGVWRVAFAFDPERTAVILVGGNKSGIGERWFYKRLIAKADMRLDRYIALLSGG